MEKGKTWGKIQFDNAYGLVYVSVKLVSMNAFAFQVGLGGQWFPEIPGESKTPEDKPDNLLKPLETAQSGDGKEAIC